MAENSYRFSTQMVSAQDLLSPGQTIATYATYRNIVGPNMFHAFGHRVAMCCNMLGVVGSTLTIFKLEPLTPNTSQHGGQTRASMLRHIANVAIVLVGTYIEQVSN